MRTIAQKPAAPSSVRTATVPIARAKMIAARRVRPSATLRPATTPMAPPNSAASTIPTKITIRMSAQRREYFRFQR